MSYLVNSQTSSVSWNSEHSLNMTNITAIIWKFE